MGDIAELFQQHGISVNISDPVWWRERTNYGDFSTLLTGYSHEIVALGGFWSADITFPATMLDLWQWFERGLGRDVTVSGPSLDVVWEGFVNKITVSAGPLTVEIGPLLDVGNHLDMVFSTIDPTTAPPTPGTRERYSGHGGYVIDAESIARYGRITRILSTGGLTGPDDARQILETFLADNKEPTVSSRFQSMSGGPATIALECAGYARWLETYIYNDSHNDLVNLSDKLISVLQADPNNIFSTDYDRITPNAVQVSWWEDEDRTAWSIIKTLVAYGYTDYRRCTFGIYQNRRAEYAPMATDIAYHQSLSEPLMVTTPTGQVVQPWQVRPARWLFYDDLLPGRELPAMLDARRTDPRFEFIESVQFIAPRGLMHSGEKQRTLKQVLSRYGLSGVGA